MFLLKKNLERLVCIMEYKQCTRCVMDTTDSEITFDDNGVCNHCINFERNIKPNWHPDEEGEKYLNAILRKIKTDCKNDEYDCVIGLSGGIDSSYLIYKAKEWGLRVLAVHVDAGWNSELAIKNIENVCKYAGYDLHTIVINWDEMRELQIAFLKSGTANQDIPQDHAFFAGLYNYAIKFNIKYVLTGSNYATESILPASWGYDAMDSKFLLDINKKFGKIKLKNFPIVSFWKLHIYYPYIKRMKVVKPLNFIYYDKDEAIKTLQDKCGWRYYGGKHHESRFTKFFQAYYLPWKFGYDKRKAHLSSLIVAGFMTREEALEELKKPLYDHQELLEDKKFIAKKLRLSDEEFEKILKLPKHNFSDFKNNYNLRVKLIKIRDFFTK